MDNSDPFRMQEQFGGFDYNENDAYSSQASAATLRDKIKYLKRRNQELVVSLEKEKEKRIDAEACLRRDRNYIQRLEETLQSTQQTKVIIDPGSYRRVAETYMATLQKPVRRTHSLSPKMHRGDLECDNRVPTPEPGCSYDSVNDEPVHGAFCKADPIKSNYKLQQRLSKSPEFHSSSSSSMDPRDYRELLHSLEKLNSGIGYT